MGVMYCEYYKDKVLLEGQPPIARGKVNWYTEEEIGKDCLSCLSLFKTPHPNEEVLEALKKELMGALVKKGFVFFDECVYRYKLNRNGSLKEFGINYHFIK